MSNRVFFQPGEKLKLGALDVHFDDRVLVCQGLAQRDGWHQSNRLWLQTKRLTAARAGFPAARTFNIHQRRQLFHPESSKAPSHRDCSVILCI
eukprot:s3839_g3.t1